jgi:DNA modification methylase
VSDFVLQHGDCIEVMRLLDYHSVDAVVCDPPYGLEFMEKEWDGFGEGLAQQKWHEAWAREAFRVLKPGGHLVAFGGSRTYHRLACAVEDAGFEVRDSLMWLYGTGFPKSLNIGEGRGTALKPAHEPIVLARKPLEGTVAANVQKWGTGVLNIDKCRVGSDPVTTHSRGTNGAFPKRPTERSAEASGRKKDQAEDLDTSTARIGRWPANVLLDEAAGVTLNASTGMQVSRFFYCAKASKKERGEGNNHPTVKPVALMEWLVKLVTPPGGVVLDPFMGSGSTGVAARRAGFRFIGIEKDGAYIQTAQKRVGEGA